MTTKMKALAKLEKNEGLTLTEVDIPNAGTDEIRIKIKKTAICGTDLHIYNWDQWAQKTIPVPMVTGHEYFGTVDQVGSAVKGYEIGDRVSGEGHITCGICRNCRAGSQHLCRSSIGVGVNRTGAFAEYLVIPARNAYKIPADVSEEIASLFDPFGNAVHTALSFDLIGEDVLITGAGPIGIMASAIARHVGARHIVVTDVNQYRLNLAAQHGATRVVNPMTTDLKDVMKDLNMREGFDVGLEMSGNSSAFRSMLEVMNNGGKISMLGIFSEEVAIDWSLVIFKCLKIKGIYGREMYETWYKMTSMIQSGLDISKVITHRLQPEDFEQGFAVMNQGQAGKVILDW
jgi:threonine 3-dehydrogenase